MQNNHILHNNGASRLFCMHCQCSTTQIGYKPLNHHLNLGGPVDTAARNLHLSPTILEALTLVFGFRMPSSSDITNGVPHLGTKAQSLENLAICINCESVLINLYKVFLLFTELSNGKESFILKNSIISGRIHKEEDVIPLPTLRTRITGGRSNSLLVERLSQAQVTNSAHSQHHLLAPNTYNSNFNQTNSSSLSTIRRELSSEVIAEVYIPNQPAGVTITPITDATFLNPGLGVAPSVTVEKLLPPSPAVNITNGTKQKPSSSTASRVVSPKNVEVITLDEEEEVQSSKSASTPSSTSADKSTQKLKHIMHNKVGSPQRFVPYESPVTNTTKSRKQNSSIVNQRGTKSPSKPDDTVTGTTPSHVLQPGSSDVSGVRDKSRLSVSCLRKGLVSEVTTTTTKHQCDKCPLYFPTIVSLLTHTYKVHGKEPLSESRESFLCPRCPSKFQSQVSLKLHLRHHTKSPQYKCTTPECGKSYNAQRLLRRHATMTGHSEGINNLNTGPHEDEESESDYWTSGIQVIHDPDQVMKKLEEAATQEKLKSIPHSSTT